MVLQYFQWLLPYEEKIILLSIQSPSCPDPKSIFQDLSLTLQSLNWVFFSLIYKQTSQTLHLCAHSSLRNVPQVHLFPSKTNPLGFPGGTVVKNPPAKKKKKRIRLPMQGTRVRALVQEDPTCRGATKPVRCNYWACALEPASHSYWAHSPQLLKPAGLEPVLRSKRSHCNEKPTDTTRESLRAATKTQSSQK